MQEKGVFTFHPNTDLAHGFQLHRRNMSAAHVLGCSMLLVRRELHLAHHTIELGEN